MDKCKKQDVWIHAIATGNQAKIHTSEKIIF